MSVIKAIPEYYGIYFAAIYGGSRIAVYKPQQQVTFYEVGDHQGNVRAVIGQPETQLYTATMEDSHSTEEDADFSPSYDEVTVINTEFHNHTDEAGATKSIRLTGLEDEIVGLAKSLKVSPGDIIDMKAWVKATNISSTVDSDVQGFLGAGFTTAMGISPTGESAELYRTCLVQDLYLRVMPTEPPRRMAILITCCLTIIMFFRTWVMLP